MILYALINILERIKGYIWKEEPLAVQVEQGAQEEQEQEQEEEQEEPVKRYNLRERKPVDYHD